MLLLNPNVSDKEYEKTIELKMFEFYSKIKLYDWQLLCHEVLLKKDSEGYFENDTIMLSVPRQQGKSIGVVLPLIFDRAFCHGESVIYTAQQEKTASSVYFAMLKIIQDNEKTLGKRVISHSVDTYKIRLKNGADIQFTTRSKSTGVGQSYPVVIFDEMADLTPAQEQAIVPVSESFDNSLIFYVGTPPLPNSLGRELCLNMFKNSKESDDVVAVVFGNTELLNNEELLNSDEIYKYNPTTRIKQNPKKIQKLAKLEISKNAQASMIDFQINRFGVWLFNKINIDIDVGLINSAITNEQHIAGSSTFVIDFDTYNNLVSLSVSAKLENNRIISEVIRTEKISKGYDWIVSFIKNQDDPQICINGKTDGDIVFDLLIKQEVASRKQLHKITAKEYLQSFVYFEQDLEEGVFKFTGQESVMESIALAKKTACGKTGWNYTSYEKGKSVVEFESLILSHYARKVIWEEEKSDMLFVI